MTKKYPPKKNQERSSYVSAVNIILAVIVIALGAYLYRIYKPVSQPMTGTNTGAKPAENVVNGTPLPSPSPRPIAQGKQIYNGSFGPLVKGPKMTQVIVDPFDPKKGEKQTVTVKIKHELPITSVTARLDSDTMKKTYTFERIDGSDTNGTWQTSWTTEDTHDYTYFLFFELVSSDATFKDGLTFR